MARAQRDANGQLCPAARRAHQQQCRDVHPREPTGRLRLTDISLLVGGDRAWRVTPAYYADDKPEYREHGPEITVMLYDVPS